MKELRIAERDLDGGVTVLDLDGALDKRTTPELERTVTSLTDKGKLRLVVNCERLTYISSDGMGVFLSHLIKIRKSGGDIKFCNMRDEARTVVSYLGSRSSSRSATRSARPSPTSRRTSPRRTRRRKARSSRSSSRSAAR